MKCAICKAPYHPATGHIAGPKTVWCGPCTKTWVKEVAAMQNRRWGGVRFYDVATPPPPAVIKTYVFTVYQRVPGTKCEFRSIEVEKQGVCVEEAICRLSDEYPNHTVGPHLKGLWAEKT